MQENCNQNVISIASILAPKMDIYAIPNDDKIHHVYDAQLIHLLSEFFRVPYKVFTPQDGEYGRKLPGGNWSGLIGMVMHSEVDLAVGGIALTEDRFHAVNFSYPFILSDYTFMTDKLKPVSRNLALLNPFPLKLWIALLAAVIFFSFLTFYLTYKTRTYPYILIMIYGSVLETSILIKLQKTSHRLLIGAWLMFTFVITNSYKAIFLSFLTLPNFTGIRDIPDLTQAAGRNLVTCYSYNNKLVSQILFQSGFDTWKPIGKCLQRNEFITESAEELFDKARPGKAFISGRIYLKPYKFKYFISADSFFTNMYAFPISNKFYCTQSYLNNMIHRLFAAGIFEKINKDEELRYEFKSLNSDSNAPDNRKALHIKDLKGAFLVLFSGYILSSILFFIEIIVNYYFPDKRLF